MYRRKTRKVKIGNVQIGGGAPISVQSMTKVSSQDEAALISQINELEKAGCDIVRTAVLNEDEIKVIGKVLKKIKIPLVADIHFNYKLALEAIKAGVNAVRLNPGNIRGKEEVEEVVNAAKGRKIPIRIGVNAGSVPEEMKGPVPEKMVRLAQDYIKVFENLNFKDIIISLKASNVTQTVEAYRQMAKVCDYPFHVGITAAGSFLDGTVKNTIGIGLLLSEGIGDTIRVSLTADPVKEVRVAKSILKALGLSQDGLDIISCPICGRCQIDLQKLVDEFESKAGKISKNRKVAIMGCMVNGPGEAKEADLGIAGGKGSGMLFRHGEKIKKVKEKDFVDTLLKELNEEGDVQ